MSIRVDTRPLAAQPGLGFSSYSQGVDFGSALKARDSESRFDEVNRLGALRLRDGAIAEISEAVPSCRLETG